MPTIASVRMEAFRQCFASPRLWFFVAALSINVVGQIELPATPLPLYSCATPNAVSVMPNLLML